VHSTQNSVFESVDAVMLGAETATGSFPVEATAAIARILVNAEEATNFAALHSFIRDFCAKPFTSLEAAASCLARTSMDATISLVVTFSASGLASMVACKYRPSVPHIVMTSDEAVAQSCSLFFGMQGCLLPEMAGTLQQGVEFAIQVAKERQVYVTRLR
jgi:pyruvate kinase